MAKTEDSKVVFEKTITDGFCSTLRTKVTVLGRVEKVPACPIGEVAYRAWDSGNAFHVELPAVGEPSYDLKHALEELAFNGTVAAYVLGCGKTTDLLVAQTGDVDVKVWFWVGGTLRPTDPRFAAP